MTWLEHRIPPVLWWVLGVAVTFLLDRADLDGSPLESPAADVIGTVLAGVGIGLGVAGIVTFSRVGTTVDPHRIENASILVTEGIYRFTRNPMYLGLVLVCAGWGIRLGSVVGTVVGSALLFGVLRQFQIIPEERMMTERFGETYERYRASVRRWI